MNCLKHWKADGTWWDPVRFVLFGGSMQQMAWGELWEPLHTRRLDEVWVLGWISGLFVKIHTDWGVGRIRVELAFRQELVLMFAPAGNICSLLAFGATVSFLSPFVRPSTVSFIHPSIHTLIVQILHLFEMRISLHTWLPLLRAGSINAYVLEASLQFLPACPPKRTTGSFMGFKGTRSKTKAGKPADRLFGYFDCSSLVSFVL